MAEPQSPITFALPKGRLLEQTAELLTRAGHDVDAIRPERLGRKLTAISDDGRLRFLVLRNVDVPTYVERGVADIGVVGRDVLLEQGCDLYEPLDLGIGRCRLVVAAPAGDSAQHHHHVRVATKYPRLARRHFMARGRQAELIKLYGSVELAPVVGLSDWIVDITETGSTLKQNGLEVLEDIEEFTARLVVGHAALKLRAPLLRPFIESLAQVLESP